VEGVQSSTAFVSVGERGVWAADENALNMKTTEITRWHLTALQTHF